MSRDLKVLVSIINYKTADLTIAAAQSVLDDLGQISGEIVIVDNASGDGSDDVIEAWIAERPERPVRLVRAGANTGFSGGHNRGMAAAQADFYLILNSDAVLRPGFLASILEAADAQPDKGLFAPQLEYDDGEVQISQFRFASPLSELIRAGHSGPLTRLFQGRQVALPLGSDPAEIEWASFACILLRGAMVAEIGPMDEGYFLYFEDAEYCLRARRAGWHIAPVPAARAVHFRGGSGPVKALAKMRKRLPGYFYASRARFLAQAHGRWAPLRANLLWHLGRAVAQTRRIFGKPVSPAAEAEARDIWINAFDPYGPRLAPHELGGKAAHLQGAQA
ncbi:MAG: glycosyltransferase family 2 protein [Pseudomonadota bacterium]